MCITSIRVMKLDDQMESQQIPLISEHVIGECSCASRMQKHCMDTDIQNKLNTLNHFRQETCLPIDRNSKCITKQFRLMYCGCTSISVFLNMSGARIEP